MKLLFIRVSAIGDVIHTLPAVFLIKKVCPRASISWVVQRKAASLLVDQPFLDNVWVLPDKFLQPKNIKKTYAMVQQIKQHQWDAVIDFQGLLKTSLVYALLKGKKYGFDSRHARERLSTLFTAKKHAPEYQNIVQKNLSMASFVLSDLTKKKVMPTTEQIHKACYFYFPHESKNKIDLWLHIHNVSRFMVLVANTTWPSKHWPEQYWQKLLLKLGVDAVEKQCSVVLVGSAFGGQAASLTAFIKKHKLNIIVAPAWDLLTTAYLIQKAVLVVAPDTGLLHMADYLGTTSIAIFGPTSGRKHGPFWVEKNKQNVFQVSCPHIYQKTHGKRGKNNCMFKLTPEMVYTRIIENI